MNRYLCMSVTFLNGVFHGKGDSDEPEWPPAPMRLFQALLAGARTGCRELEWTETRAESFRWLECQPAPVIVTPDVFTTPGYTFFVPDNVADREFEREKRLVTKVSCPNRLMDGDTVHYLWQLEDEASAVEHAASICREARHMMALGWGIDQVTANGRILSDTEAYALPDRRWQAWEAFRPGAKTLRIPITGSLADIEKAYDSFLGRLENNIFHPPIKISRFNTVTYLSVNALPPRSYGSFELPDGVSFRQENIVKAAAMLRSVACEYAKTEPNDYFPGGSQTYVAGHTGKQETTPARFSYLPLPSIGYEHADGRIRRFFIAEPYDGDGAYARWAQRRLCGEVLIDEIGNERGRLLEAWRQTSKMMFDRYSEESRAWCTVTPVILPGFDDGAHRKAEKLFLVAIQQAGLPVEAVKDIMMRKAPFYPGSQHPRQYFLPDYLRGRPGWHVRLVLREPVPGPLAIGAGRHIGLGIFARSEE